MYFGVLGDIHGDFAAADRVMRAHDAVQAWLCVGDVASDDGEYWDPVAPLYWIKGNNEGFDAIAALALPPNLRFIPNGVRMTIDGIAVAGLGGTFAPKWYATAAADLPAPPETGAPRARGKKPPDDKRRHFVREEVEACRRMRGIDVFLSHEAPRPYPVGRPGPRPAMNDAGKTPINEVLAAMQPRVHFFGHHHRYTEAVRQGVRSIGLDLVSRSYVLVDTRKFDVEKHDT